jgi:hypothetical protein
MTNDLISPDLRLTVIYTVFSCSLYIICALLQISLMQLCRLARHFWTDALVPYRENIFSGIFFRRSGFATVRHENGSFLRDQSIAIEFPAGGVREPFHRVSPGQESRYLTIFPIACGSIQGIRNRSAPISSAEPGQWSPPVAWVGRTGGQRPDSQRSGGSRRVKFDQPLRACSIRED